ncbi:PREDICTED: uncharacterized protein LOC105965659 [Erythranthe guttata]|nr:PREDICTED: uncharacterized protein LOC105965659 [Erythranthe guttata]|eukprot:XP_012845681.1 PREDICTED: uncharacterized protein LOC105965659 [Erythranthe guttata]
MVLTNGMVTRHNRMANADSTSGVANRDWKVLWNFPLPPKIRMFLWRLGKNSIPTNVELYRRKIGLSPRCARCHKEEEEDALHILTTCQGMETIWRSPPFDKVSGPVITCAWQWIMNLREQLCEEFFILAMVVAWQAWDRRNKELKGEEIMAVEALVGWCGNYVANFKCAQLRPNPSLRSAHPTEWKPPERDFVKLNFDVATKSAPAGITVAAVARNAEGRSLGWKVCHIQGNLLPVEGEALAALHAINLAQDRSWQRISIEGDCLQVINALRNRSGESLSFGAIVDECCSISRNFLQCDFSFVKRSGNSLAHALAHVICTDSLEGIDLPLHLASTA